MKKIKEIFQKFKRFPPAELEIFLAEILNQEKSFVIIHPEYELSWLQYLKFIYFVCQRTRGYSVAAIIGHKEFYGLDFYVNKKVLIPRPDTELLVEEAVRTMNEQLKTKNDKIILIDVGTGSGCIPISILKNLTKRIPAYATDISALALKVAKKNAKKHMVDIRFFHGDLLEPMVSILKPLNVNSKIIITANLPYLTEQQFQNEPSIQREPKIALVAENNGLALYEELLKKIKAAGLQAIIFLEIDPSQTTTIQEIIKKYFPDSNVEIKKDLAELERMVKIKI